MVNETVKKWDSLPYQRMASVRRREPDLEILFEDGSQVVVRAQRLLPSRIGSVDWDTLTHNPYEIIVQTADGPYEIPWDTVRVLSDEEFSAHRAAAAEDEARLVGQRIRELRTSRGLSSKELAGRASITPQSLSRIELGRHDVVLTTLERILAAMGCSLKDLVIDAPTPASF